MNKCQQCNLLFKPTKNSLGKFCSRKCMGLSYKTRLKVKCAECGKNFEVIPSRFKRSPKKVFFCNRECKDKAQSLDGSCMDIRPLHYGTSNHGYRGYNIKAFNRKENKCGGCGENRRYLLMVHHKDGNKLNNKLENLEIVCYNCHIKRHLLIKGKKIIHRFNVLTPRELLDKV